MHSWSSCDSWNAFVAERKRRTRLLDYSTTRFRFLRSSSTVSMEERELRGLLFPLPSRLVLLLILPVLLIIDNAAAILSHRDNIF